MRVPAPPFTHLHRLTDAGGLYEHARGILARPEHGYCVDDVARALVVVCRETDSSVAGLRDQYLDFVLAAQSEDGRFRNRRDTDRCWRDLPSVEDCWGRALWGLGAAVAGPDAAGREQALAAFERGARLRSPWSRAMAFAALGAAQVLSVRPDNAVALGVLDAAALQVGGPLADSLWIWPEPRLTYANAAVPETLLAAGAALDRPALIDDGLRLLGWLLDLQTVEGHLSVVPVAGRGPLDDAGEFDQQPIEVAALADGCARAYAITGDARWAGGIDLAASWFLGVNDSGTSLYDADSGGGCDGLMREGRNENQGAESTLALISAWQQARWLARCRR